MKKDDQIYLHHILDAIQQIEEYTHEIEAEDFHSKRMVQDSVVRELEIIGEASARISSTFRDLNPDIPWADIIGLRNRIIHAYFNINFQVVWEIVKNNLPELKRQISKLIKKNK